VKQSGVSDATDVTHRMLLPADLEVGWWLLEARHSQQCLGVLNWDQLNGGNVVQGKACDTTNFKWKIKQVPGSTEYYHLIAQHSNQCLGVLNLDQLNGANVVQGRACDTPNFEWAFLEEKDGGYLVKARHSGQCLGVFLSSHHNGANVVQGIACDTDNFIWDLKRP